MSFRATSSHAGKVGGVSEAADVVMDPSPATGGGAQVASASAVGSDGMAAASLDNSEAGAAGRAMRRGWLVRRMLLAADVLALLIAFFATELLFSGTGPHIDRVGVRLEIAIFLGTLPAWIVAAKLYGLYDRDEERAAHSTADEFVSVFHLITVAVWLFYAFSWIGGLTRPDQVKLATFWALAIACMTTSRSAARAVARRQAAYLQNTVIVGAGDVGQRIARKLLQHPEYGINVIGFVDAEPKERRRDLGDLQLLGGPDELQKIVRSHAVERVIIAFSNERHEELLELVRELGEHDLQIDLVPRLFEAVNPQVAVHSVEGLPLLGLPSTRVPRSSRFVKRCFDVAGAAILLALTAPLISLIALLIKRDSPGPAFFRQTRIGMNMRDFTLFKFRTMYDGTADGPHREYVKRIMDAKAELGPNSLYKLERASEMTRVGRWLRKTSLDELPQLFNVLRGDMSLVGPRPCLPYEMELFAPHHFERFNVPAGLTGLWQVEARAHSTFVEALDLDVAYARGWSFGLDLRLLARTPLLVLRQRETG